MKTLFVFLMLACSTSFAATSAQDVCASIVPKSSVSTLEACISNYEAFVNEQQLMAVGEMAKAVIKADASISKTILTLGVATAKSAESKGIMYAQNTHEGVNLNALNYGAGGGVTCDNALDYAADDYDPPFKKGVYSCSISMNTRIIYLTNTCEENADKIWDQQQEELVITFEISEKGVIDAKTISTKAFEIVRSCAA